MGRHKKPIEIDYSAAMPPEPTSLATNTATLLPQPPYINKDILVNDSNKMILVNDISVLESINEDHQVNIKDQLTQKEIKFLEYFIVNDMTIEEAMISAGYGDFHHDYRYVKARKIIQKYERSAPNARKIFRDIGFGELSVAQGIKKLAKGARSEVVRLNAHQIAAKCLEMIKDTPTINQGIQIVITCSAEETPTQHPGQYRPATIYLEQQAPKEKPGKP